VLTLLLSSILFISRPNGKQTYPEKALVQKRRGVDNLGGFDIFKLPLIQSFEGDLVQSAHLSVPEVLRNRSMQR
jgi:hypothetical protein